MVINGQVLVQGVGLILLLIGAVMLWGPGALVVGGALMLVGPELARVNWAAVARAVYASLAAAGRVGMASQR